jgi:hypothetical protein
MKTTIDERHGNSHAELFRQTGREEARVVDRYFQLRTGTPLPHRLGIWAMSGHDRIELQLALALANFQPQANAWRA